MVGSRNPSSESILSENFIFILFRRLSLFLISWLVVVVVAEISCNDSTESNPAAVGVVINWFAFRRRLADERQRRWRQFRAGPEVSGAPDNLSQRSRVGKWEPCGLFPLVILLCLCEKSDKYVTFGILRDSNFETTRLENQMNINFWNWFREEPGADCHQKRDCSHNWIEICNFKFEFDLKWICLLSPFPAAAAAALFVASLLIPLLFKCDSKLNYPPTDCQHHPRIALTIVESQSASRFQ